MPDMPSSYRPPIEFEWDTRKAASNAAKHGITFEDGIDLFSDPAHFVWDVSRSADGERRWKAVGMIDGRVFVAVFAWRGPITRLISVRRANQREERIYGDRKNEA